MALVACACALIFVAAPADGLEGISEPHASVDVASFEPGLVAKVHVELGAKVSKGEILCELDDQLLGATLEIAKVRRQARGRLLAAQAEHALRKERWTKLEALRKGGNASQEEVNRALADEQIAAANVLSLEEEQQIAAIEVQRIEQQIERRKVRSPIAGVVVTRHYEVGESISPTALAVMTVIQVDPLRVVVHVPSQLVSRLTSGASIPVTFVDPEIEAPGAVEYIAPVADAESGTVKVHLTVKNGDGRIRAGSRCKLSLPASAK